MEYPEKNYAGAQIGGAQFGQSASMYPNRIVGSDIKTGIQREASPIDGSMKRLEGLISRSAENFIDFADRLTPIRRETGKAGGVGGHPVPLPTCELQGRIDRVSDLLEMLDARINECRSELCL